MPNEKAHVERFELRLPADVKARLAREAEANGRSLNSEIVVRLRERAVDARRATAQVA